MASFHDDKVLSAQPEWVTIYAKILAAKIFGGQALKVSFRGE
jgi:hypothetical protein